MDVCTRFDPNSIVCVRCVSTHELIEFENDMQKFMETGKDIALICYDIRSLRKINHAYGRKAGDAVLAAVAEYVSEITGGTVYRIDGDLYCAVLRHCKQEQALELAYEIERRFTKPWRLTPDCRDTSLYVNVVLAVIEVNAKTFDCPYPDLFEQALENSRKLKTVTLFDTESEQVSQEHIRLQMDLRSCILEDMNGFDINFQPIADPLSGTWEGLEALCRWQRPGHGWVSPYTFIKEAEEMGYIHNIGAWMLERAMETCMDLGLHRLDSFFISVNVSPLQVIRHDFAQSVIDIIERRQYPYGKLLLEITESSEFSINEHTRSTIDRLRGLGVRFALDDFGTGYSSFSSLKNMPIDYLKTEHEFIRNIEHDSYLQYFFFMLSEVARNSGMKLIAEGVETKEQLDCVVRNGADLIQGYYFGKPMDSKGLAADIRHFYESSPDLQYLPMDYMDFQKWSNSKVAYSITPALFSLLSRCMDTLLHSTAPDEAVNEILREVGEHFKVNRAFVFLSEDSIFFSNRYEWCADNVESQMAFFQDVDSASDGFYDILTHNSVYIMTNKTQLPQNLSERLQLSGHEDTVESLVIVPLSRDDHVIGYEGFDDSVSRQWTPEEMILLHNLCLLVLIVLNHQRASDQYGDIRAIGNW